jgi:hypothetical protein
MIQTLNLLGLTWLIKFRRCKWEKAQVQLLNFHKLHGSIYNSLQIYSTFVV